MREYQRGTRTYAENTFPMQKGRNENNAEAIKAQSQDDASIQRTDLNNKGLEGMMYLDIIPRFAL